MNKLHTAWACEASIRQLNAEFRKQDESHLYPINNKFNVTERAIRRVRKLAQACGPICGSEYVAEMENEISQIVNDERNW